MIDKSVGKLARALPSFKRPTRLRGTAAVLVIRYFHMGAVG